MLKLAIYGDSFADVTYLESLVDKKLLHGTTWIEILATKFQITNYAYGGTGVYYSYLKFLENQENHDINLFLISQFSRVSVPMIDLKRPMHVVPGIFLEKYDQVLEKYKLYPNDIKIIESIKGYVEYIMDDKKDKIFSDLMIDDIKKIRPETFFIDLFEGNCPLVSLSWAELHEENLSYDILRKEGFRWDLRKCHFTEDNHFMIAEKILLSINYNIKNIHFFKTDLKKSTKPILDYFKKDDYGPGNF